VPEDAMIEELPAMKVAGVRECVEAIAAHVSLDPDYLLELEALQARRTGGTAPLARLDVDGLAAD
jgi:hypothetical protein